MVVPRLGLRHQRLDPLDRGRIRRAVSLAADDGEAAILASSYGGALALVALADDPALQREVTAVATIGTYFDAFHLLQAVTTGAAPYRGRTIPWRTVPEARDVLVDALASFLGEDQADALGRAIRARDPVGLDAAARSVHELVVNRDSERVPELVRALPPDLRLRLSSLWRPPSHAARTRGPRIRSTTLEDLRASRACSSRRFASGSRPGSSRSDFWRTSTPWPPLWSTSETAFV